MERRLPGLHKRKLRRLRILENYYFESQTIRK